MFKQGDILISNNTNDYFIKNKKYTIQQYDSYFNKYKLTTDKRWSSGNYVDVMITEKEILQIFSNNKIRKQKLEKINGI